MEESNNSICSPLLKGCITGQLHALFSYYRRSMFDNLAGSDVSIFNKKFPLNQIPNKMLLKKEFLFGSICSAASLGTFEIVSKRASNGNDGSPLSLYQEAGCGLISAATAAFLRQPFQVALNRVQIQNLTYTNWFTSLHQILKNERRPSILWRGSGVAMAIETAAYAGMLASHDRSFDYLLHTHGLSKWNAQLSASVIGGFCCAACAVPVLYAGATMNVVQRTKPDAESVCRSVCNILNPFNGGTRFYNHFLKAFRAATGFCMVQYSIYECVRGMEWTNK